MRHIRLVVGPLLLAGLGFVGCTWSDKEVRPPKPPEEFVVPPEDDARYGKPHEYPKDTLDQDMLLKKTKDGGKSTPGPIGGRGPGAMGCGPSSF